MATIDEKVEKIYGAKLLIFASLILLVMTNTLFANETRGLIKIFAKDASGQQKEVTIYNKTYAVIIGIDQYQNLSFDQQLSYAKRDAQGVEQVLRKNFKFDKVISLYNKDATKDNILKTLLGDLTKEVTKEDAVFVFWAGHGYTEKTDYGDIGYMIPFDGTFNTSELYKNISMTTLKDDISKKIPAKHVFYVMDACYSGLLVATRGAERKSARDLNYIQEITKENARQVLTAGDKGQEVLDGGPKGHSVFTGRFIEILENTDDFITATEISTMLKEKVFSDARARNHTQTPRYGELFGVGDFVFVPSIEQKVEDTQTKITDLQKELEKLQSTEKAALKAKDERVRRQAEIEKRTVEAKLKAEQLRQQALEEERKKRELEERERLQREKELARQKKADDERLASLKRTVEKRRKSLGGTTLSSLSPEATVTEMQEIDAKIKEIRKQFREELKNGINQIVNRLNDKYLRLADARKDEFESETEFKSRIAKEKSAIDREQTGEFTVFQDRLEKEYNQQINPFIDQLKKLSTNEFTITSENLMLELGNYDAKFNSYPVTIKAKQPVKGIMVAANANVPIPREDAREFKQHFQNNMLRPEIKGNFQTPEVFMIAQAYIIDDATTKQYDLFSARFVDLGNGTLYDASTKLIWSKKGSEIDINWSAADSYLKRLNQTTYLGFRDWRMPTLDELRTLASYAKGAGYGSGNKTIAAFLNKEGFTNVQPKWYWTSILTDSQAWYIDFDEGEEKTAHRDYFRYRDNALGVLPVRSGR